MSIWYLPYISSVDLTSNSPQSYALNDRIYRKQKPIWVLKGHTTSVTLRRQDCSSFGSW